MALKVVNPPQKPVTRNNLCSEERCKRYRNIPANATPETLTIKVAISPELINSAIAQRDRDPTTPPSDTYARWRALIFNLKRYLLFC